MMSKQEGEKRRAGAPRKAEEKKRTEKLMLNLTPEEKALYQSAADEMGLSMAGFFRRAAKLMLAGEGGRRK
jgi:hypothetical protein